jgi:hypothetical protein
MEEDAIQNKSLFHVDGRERILFDEKLNMELPAYEGKSDIFQTPGRQKLTYRGEVGQSHSRIQHRCPSYQRTSPLMTMLMIVPTNESLRRQYGLLRKG